MKRLPLFLLPQTVTMKLYKGDGGNGPLYELRQNVRCRVERRVKVVYTKTGPVKRTTLTVYCNTDIAITEQSIITYGAHDYTVIGITDVQDFHDVVYWQVEAQ